MKSKGVAPSLPPLEWGEYLINFLWEFGPGMPTGSGSGPVTFSEMDAWQRVCGIDLQPWEAQLLRRLSIEYCNESCLATKPNRPPPFGAAPEEARLNRLRVQKDLDKFLA